MGEGGAVWTVRILSIGRTRILCFEAMFVVNGGKVISEVCQVETCMTRVRAPTSSVQKDTRQSFEYAIACALNLPLRTER